ncbi:Cytochrome P450 family protein [Metarhizium album ARSEF 1941]|uniref:Cytochrome P450 family protein n=1 Tax=Metarhizium album (strain ARSEF 1941) TaxID=1081103 RepID=A0A0B2WMV1_METAS|nr:Cytochrome P450 family protein [Metarhizium album ARSEF 1941]KHN95024.1 Cytochrome P450 family protein [Metarhizium album ARSEF 1941]
MELDSLMALSAAFARLVWRFVSLTLLGIVAVTLQVVVYRLTFHPLAKVPGPKWAATSNFWYARQIAQGRMAQLGLEMHRKYGDIVRIGPNEVWFNTTEAFDQIYCTGKGFEKSDFYLATALTRPSIDWKFNANFEDTLDLLSERNMKRYRLQRRLIGRVYSAANVAKYEDALTAALERVVKRLSDLDGKEIDLKEWMHIITVECLGAAVLSWSPGLLRDGTDWATLSHSFQGWRRKCLFGVFPAMKKMEQLSPSLGRAFASLWGVTYRPPPTFKPFFPLRKDRPEFNEAYLRKMAVTNFGAGHETLASTLTASVAMIASHMDVQEQVIRELRTAEADGALAYATSNHLPFTRAAIREAMRLYPVVPMSLPRKTPPTGMHVHGLSVPANTTVGCSPISLHRREDIYGASPDLYNPGRWLRGHAGDETAAVATPSVRMMDKYSLNWGGGSRSCPGRSLAELVVLQVIATLFGKFEVKAKIPPDADKEAYFLFVLSGVKVKFLPRNK